jgi:hypothetical protein
MTEMQNPESEIYKCTDALKELSEIEMEEYTDEQIKEWIEND